MGSFKFNGKSSEDFGLFIQTPPTYSYPERDMTATHVPGRNGNIVIDNNSYKNVERAYLVGKKYSGNTGYYDNFQMILDWLSFPKGKYVVLEDTYDSDIYRLASFQAEGSFVDYFNKAGATTISFNCKPQRFLKSGDVDLIHVGKTYTIENLFGYVALPIIKISDIPANIDVDKILMMSVNDESGKSISSVTFTKFDEFVLNSEEQTVTDDLLNDKYDSIGLNGKPFPRLMPGKSIIRFDVYSLEFINVNSYNNKILIAQYKCNSDYMTYASIESTNQKKVFVKTYDSLIESKKESYAASAVQSMITNNAETYTFEPFSSLMDTQGSTYEFYADLSQETDFGENSTHDWIRLEAIHKTQSDPETDIVAIKAIATIDGFYMIKGPDKRIRFLTANSVISSDIKPNSINTIKYYKAIDDWDVNQLVFSYYVSGSHHYRLNIGYENVPNWLAYDILYDSNGSPMKLLFKRTAVGYYWTDKIGLFDKAQWKLYSTAGVDTFLTLSWSTSKVAFMIDSIMSFSTTTSYTYKYVDCTSQTLPEYEPITKTSVDEVTGEKKQETTNAVHFIVKDTSSPGSLSTISIYPKDIGWYRIQLSSNNNPTVWKNMTVLTDPIISGVKGTASFEIFYLKDVPTYEGQQDWPEWIDPNPVKTGGTELEPTSLAFKILDNKFYRVSSTAEDEVGTLDAWVAYTADDVLSMAKTPFEAYYIYMTETKPSTYSYNRSYTVSHASEDPSTVKPSWLTVEYEPNDASKTPERIIYKAAVSGYYKWDNSSAWLFKNVGDNLFESGGQDNSEIYYMDTLPIYTDEDLIDSGTDFSDLLSVSATLNDVTFTVLETGYYKVNNSTDWVYYQQGESLLVSKINENNTIYHLKEVEDITLNALKLAIKPRWWML